MSLKPDGSNSSSNAKVASSSSGKKGNSNNKAKTPSLEEVNHAWEAFNSQQTWENAVQEDDEGNIIVSGGDSMVDAIRRRRKRLEQNDYSQRNRRVVRDMIRYMYVLIDASRWMRDKDPVLPPGTRIDVTISMLQQFVLEFYDQNPLSHLGFILLKNGEAEILTPLSSSPKAHKLALQSVAKMAASEGPTGGGEFSLQNGLEVAGRSLGHQPKHGSREIVIIFGALSTCDPGFVLTETLPRLKATHIRVSTLALAAEMHVCRKLAEETSGVTGVVLDKPHFRDWLLAQCVPPPALRDQQETDFCCDMVQMGFPTRTISDVPTLVHNTTQKNVLLTTIAYTCPQCWAKVSELPADCTVCGLKLVLSPHLARSFHHLFPVAPFAEVTVIDEKQQQLLEQQFKADKAMSSSSPQKKKSKHPQLDDDNEGPRIKLTSAILTSTCEADACCYACQRPAGTTPDDIIMSKCPECCNIFCVDCDAYMHETLHNCPGCLSN